MYKNILDNCRLKNYTLMTMRTDIFVIYIIEIYKYSIRQKEKMYSPKKRKKRHYYLNIMSSVHFKIMLCVYFLLP